MELFHGVWTSSISLFILLSGDNYSELLEPAFQLSPWYCLYFIIYIFLGVYLLLPLVLAVVVDTYKGTQSFMFKSVDIQKKAVKKDRVKERKALMEAFVLLDMDNTGTEVYSEHRRLIFLKEKLNLKSGRGSWKKKTRKFQRKKLSCYFLL